MPRQSLCVLKRNDNVSHELKMMIHYCDKEINRVNQLSLVISELFTHEWAIENVSNHFNVRCVRL